MKMNITMDPQHKKKKKNDVRTGLGLGNMNKKYDYQLASISFGGVRRRFTASHQAITICHRLRFPGPDIYIGISCRRTELRRVLSLSVHNFVPLKIVTLRRMRLVFLLGKSLLRGRTCWRQLQASLPFLGRNS